MITEQISLPVWPDFMAEDFFQFTLQAPRHIKQEEKSGSEEVDEAQDEAGTIRVFEMQRGHLVKLEVVILFADDS